MKRIGILSDTHGRLGTQAYNALADCDVFIHAGDIGLPSILRELETLGEVYAVLGNNDYNEYGNHVGYFARPTIEGVSFLVAHYPRDVRISALGSAALAPGDPIPQVRVHGHTHIPELVWGEKARPSQLLLCPGSVSRPRNGSPRSVAKIEVENGSILRAAIEDLHGGEIVSIPRLK